MNEFKKNFMAGLGGMIGSAAGLLACCMGLNYIMNNHPEWIGLDSYNESKVDTE